MNKNIKKIILAVFIILLLVGLVIFAYRYYRNKKSNNIATKNAVSIHWIDVSKGLPLDFPNIPLVTADTVLTNRYYEQSVSTTVDSKKQKALTTNALQAIHGEYKYTATNANVPLKETAQQFYNNIMSKNSWNITQNGGAINATDKSGTVNITFTPVDSAHTTIDINYVQQINAQ